jgi:hypothetical protein
MAVAITTAGNRAPFECQIVDGDALVNYFRFIN